MTTRINLYGNVLRCPFALTKTPALAPAISDSSPPTFVDSVDVPGGVRVTDETDSSLTVEARLSEIGTVVVAVGLTTTQPGWVYTGTKHGLVVAAS